MVMVKTGIMGGTFDPVHNAHIAVAVAVRERLNLDRVLFIPAGQPWLKADRTVSPAEHRAAMVRLAIADNPGFELSTVEIERKGPTYTVDTVTELRRQAGTSDELYLVLGWDNVSELPQWRQPARLIERCFIVAVPRPGYPPPDIKSLESAIPGLSRKLILMDSPEIDISASEIRSRIGRGLPIHDLVPEAVERYIQEHKLYISPGANEN